MSPSLSRMAAAAILVSFAAAALDCSGNKSNGLVYETGDASYDIICGSDYAGGDLKTQTTASFEDCIALCDSTARCIDVSYVPSRALCYMKSNLGTLTTNGDIWTARNRIYETDTYLTCDNNHSNGTLYDTTGGNSYEILCNVDYAGGDMAASNQNTFVACLEVCDNTPGCIDVSYVQPSCYLKSSLTKLSAAGNVWTGKRVKKVISSSTSSSQVQTSSTTAISSSMLSSTVSIQPSSSSSSLSSSSLTPSVSSSLSSSSFVESTSSAVTSISSTDSTSMLTTLSSSTELPSSSILVSSSTQSSLSTNLPSSTFVTSSSEQSSSSSVSASSSDLTTSSSASSEQSSSSTSLSGAEISSSQSSSDIMSGSATQTSSQDFSISSSASISSISSSGSLATSGSTSPVSSVTSSANSGTVTVIGSTPSSLFTATSTTSTSVFAVPTQTPPSCVKGASDGTNYTMSTGSIYEINCGYEHYGGDLYAAYAASFEGCMSQCDATTNCVDISYVGTTCYMKQTVSKLVVSPNAWSATRVQNSTSTTLELSCFHAKTNGSVFSTEGGNYYEILCNMDFPGGDISAIKTDTFEECLNSCDKTLGCIDVSYVAPSCYLKSSTATPVVANNVWAAMAVESPAPTACAAGGIDLYPVRNEDVVATALSSLDPAINATLNYAEKYPGTNAVSLYLNMLYPQVSLENSALLGTTCSNTSLTVTADSQTTLDYIMSHWPSSDLVLFTNTEGCNTEKSRGIYLTTSALATSGSLAIVFGVAQKNFTDVASDVTIKYGTITYDADDIAVADPQYTSTCAETGTLTAAPTATATSSSGSATVLDAGAQRFYDLLAAAVQYTDDGNIIGHPSNTQNVTVDVNPYDPTNTTEQAALEDMLEAMGLDSPESLASQASNGAKGVCYAPTKTSSTSAVSRRSNSKNLSKRLSWDDITEYACDDTIDDLVGIVTDALGDACEVNDAVQNVAALGCLLKGGCYTTTTIITYYTPPPATDYTFDYSWNVGFGPIQQDVVYGGANKRVSCVNCGFSISNLEFSGEIIINMTSGIIKQADITTGISGVANMVAGFKSDGAWNGNWSYTYSTTNLGSISIDSAFNIVPTVLYGIGINYQTDSAVDTSGGAQFSLNNAVASMNLLTGDVTKQTNWNPSISFTNPAFTTGSSIELQPYMRWGVNLEVSIYGQVALSPYIASQTIVGMDSQYAFEAQGSCPANNLAVTSYVSTKNTISNGMGVSKSLYTNQQYNPEKCYDVPSNQPAPSDIASLSSVGQAFCTSYINYKAPTALYFSTSTTTVPSTVGTVDHTVTITSTPVITIYPTSTIDFWYTATAASSTVWVTATNSASLRADLVKRNAMAAQTSVPEVNKWQEEQGMFVAGPARSLNATAPTLAKYDGVVRRAATPSLVSDWPASKISYACSQIATGSTTVTSTVTATATSGTVTATRTVTANAQGPLSTVTRMFTTYEFQGFTTTTTAGTRTSTAYSCPLQTEVSSCITITGHGPKHIDGQLLRYASMYSNPSFSPNFGGYIWYLSCNGTLEALTTPNTMAWSGYPSAGDWVSMNWDWYIDRANLPLMTCTKDPSTKALNCNQGGWTEMWVLPPTYINYYDWDFDDRVADPYWGPDSYSEGNSGSAISFTYDEVECPCDNSHAVIGSPLV